MRVPARRLLSTRRPPATRRPHPHVGAHHRPLDDDRAELNLDAAARAVGGRVDGRDGERLATLRFLPPSRGSRRVERSKPFWELREQWSASAVIAQATERANAPASRRRLRRPGQVGRAAATRRDRPGGDADVARGPRRRGNRRRCRCAAAGAGAGAYADDAEPRQTVGGAGGLAKGEKSVRQRWRRRRPGSAPPRLQQRHHQITSLLAEGYHVRTRGGDAEVPRELRDGRHRREERKAAGGPRARCCRRTSRAPRIAGNRDPPRVPPLGVSAGCGRDREKAKCGGAKRKSQKQLWYQTVELWSIGFLRSEPSSGIGSTFLLSRMKVSCHLRAAAASSPSGGWHSTCGTPTCRT